MKLSAKEKKRANIKAVAAAKFWEKFRQMKKMAFEMSSMEIFAYIDQIHSQLTTKDVERRFLKVEKDIQNNFYSLEAVDKISQYTKTASYFMKYPIAKQINEYMDIEQPTYLSVRLKKELKAL